MSYTEPGIRRTRVRPIPPLARSPTMPDVALFDAKNRLSELIHRVEAGEEIAITRRGKVVARLVPAHDDDARQRALDAVAALKASRQGVSLGHLKSRDLVREGRR
jgi:prevent-host-death family protein